MDDKTKTTQSAKGMPEVPTDPNLHFQQWLDENNYDFSINALPQNNPLLEGKGFVLTDRPLLILTMKRKDSK